jgi:hypothetical protein
MTRRGSKVPKPPRPRKRTKHEEWLDGALVQCAILGIDPGDEAGAALMVPGVGGPSLVFSRAVDTNTRQLESVLEDAVREARARGIPLMLYAEEWGAGGPLGIDQWLGLGEKIGAWRRAAILMCDTARPTIVPSRLMLRVGQSTWRSGMGLDFGTRDAGGAFTRHDAEGWKKEANKRVHELFGYLDSFDSNASEAVLIAYYGCRDERIEGKIPKRPTGGTRHRKGR